MMRQAFAKLPSAWARKKSHRMTYVPLPLATESSGSSPSEGTYAIIHEGLGLLRWSAYKSHASAALLVLFALAIISNKAQRKDGLRKNDLVEATYSAIQDVAPLSRKLVCEGLKLLHQVGAITSERQGTRNVYRLVGINEGGQWCELPQQHLLNNFGHMHRLSIFVEQIKRPTTLHALKLYTVLLAFRHNHLNATRMSYDSIIDYTGMRREDISTAVQLLVATQLCRIATDEEVPRRPGDRMHNRYLILGLASS